MRKLSLIAAMLFAALSAVAGITVSSPSSGSTVGSPVHFVASASSSANSIASIVVWIDGTKKYIKYASSIDTYISLGSGSHRVVTKAWDNSGNVFQDTRYITVSGTSSSSSGSGVYISTPSNGATVSSPAHFVASATPSGSSPIASMKMYVDGHDGYLTYSNKMDTYVSLGAGSHNIVIKAWDNSGKVYQASETVNVGSSTTSSSSSGSTSNTIGMHVSAPTDGSTVGSSVHLAANATGYHSISAIKVYIDGNDAALVYSSSIDKYVTVGSGSHRAVFRAWDSTGQTYDATVNFSVSGSSGSSTSSSSSSGAKTIYGIESMSGWKSCSDCASTPSGTGGTIAGFSMSQHQSSPSLDGSSTKYSIWGTIPYSDVLWYKSLSSIMGSTAVNNAHHFIYDAYFYIEKPQYAQAIEFDINQYVNGHSLVFGTQCNLRNGNQWDYWNNREQKWVHSGIYCGVPSAYKWHHVILEVERDTDSNWLHYISVTLDGSKHYFDKWDAPGSTSWNAVTVNFQLDGDYAMHDYSVWVDKFNFIYW